MLVRLANTQVLCGKTNENPYVISTLPEIHRLVVMNTFNNSHTITAGCFIASRISKYIGDGGEPNGEELSGSM